jgi:hypothetical protein
MVRLPAQEGKELRKVEPSANSSRVSDFAFLYWKKQLCLLAFCKQSR